MTDQSRRRSSRNLSRRERRAAGIRPYHQPIPTRPQATAAPRRSYMAEPAPIDYTSEYRWVRKDLLRILIWASLLIGAMIVLALLPIF